MTVSREQAQMLTTLAVACRPHRAPTWDEAGVMAAIAKVREWSLPEVALRVIVCAADREARTPAVIASPATRIPELKPAKWEPEVLAAHERCSVCSHARHEDAGCTSCAKGDDHEFRPDIPFVVPGGVKSAVDELRDHKAHAGPHADPPRTSGTKGTKRVAAVREALATSNEPTTEESA